MADGAPTNKRTTGIRQRVLAHLAAVGAVEDPSGMASKELAQAVGYPRSSVAFAQLLSGMERAGLIERHVRGKRTYRIALAKPGRLDSPLGGGWRGMPGGDNGAARRIDEGDQVPERRPRRFEPSSFATAAFPTPRGLSTADGSPARVPGASEPPGDTIDYDELARRLLAEVARQLATETAGAERDESRQWPTRRVAALERTVSSIKQELTTSRSALVALTEENAQLKRQLAAARRDLALFHERSKRLQSGGRLGEAEVALLERLLSPPAAGHSQQALHVPSANTDAS